MSTFNVFTWFSRKRPGQFSVSVWHKFMKPPWGGGNQFSLALCKALRQHGVIVHHNRLARDVDVHLLNSIWFDGDMLIKYKEKNRLKVVHRVDGPMQLHRKKRDEDDLCFRMNNNLASATIVQSQWTFDRLIELDYHPVKPTIIHNAVDPDIFNSNGRVSFDRGRKVRLISTGWSNNPLKGGHIYKWIDENLDTDRFEYTYVGNVSENFQRIKVVPPVDSDGVARLLREHDIYITAGKFESCSNALIEALSCGLPALFLNDSSHPEVVGSGGLPFDGTDDILTQLDKLVINYEHCQAGISVQMMDEVAGKYLAVLREAVES